MKKRVIELFMCYVSILISGYPFISGVWKDLYKTTLVLLIIVFIICTVIGIVKSIRCAKAIGVFGVKYMDATYFNDKDL